MQEYDDIREPVNKERKNACLLKECDLSRCGGFSFAVSAGVCVGVDGMVMAHSGDMRL